MVGLVRWGRNHPDLKENLSGGVGFVRWRRNGLWDEMWEMRVITQGLVGSSLKCRSSWMNRTWRAARRFVSEY